MIGGGAAERRTQGRRRSRCRPGAAEGLLRVSREWDRPSIHAALIHTFQALEADELPTRVIAVAVDLDLRQADEVLAGLVGRPLDDSGATLRSTGGGRYTLEPVPDGQVDPRQEPVRALVRRLGEDFLTTLDTAVEAGICAGQAPGGAGGQLDTACAAAVAGCSHKVSEPVLPAVEFAGRAEVAAWSIRSRRLSRSLLRATLRAGLHRLTSALAARLWHLPPHDDTDWAHDVALYGTEAATEAREPESLAGLLALSARWFADAGDFATAEVHGVRESRVRRGIGDAEGIADALWRRAHIYRRAGHAHFALDCYRELSADCQDRGDRRGLARALAATGVTLLASGRPDAAVEQLRRAAVTHDRQPVDHASASDGASVLDHASVLEQLGRALWELGETGSTRRSACWSTWTNRRRPGSGGCAPPHPTSRYPTPDGAPITSDP